MSYSINNLKKGRWIKIESPVSEDVDFLKAEFPFLHPLNLEDSLERVARPKMDLYEKYLFLALVIPVGVEATKRVKNFEVSLFLTDDALITVTHENSEILKDSFEDSPNPQALAYRILDNLYRKSEAVAVRMAAAIQGIDDRILTVRSPSIIREMAILERNLVYFSTNLETATPYFRALGGTGLGFGGSPMREYWDDLADRLAEQRDLLSDQEILLAALARSHEMFVTHRTNHIINILTVFSAIFLPLNLVAGIYGMNFGNLPFVNATWGFVAIIGFMVAIAFGLLAYFKWKKWI